MKTILGAVLLCLSFLSHSPAFAAPKETPAEAVAMTERAVVLLKTTGTEKSFAQFADPANTSFHDRGLYIYVYDMSGTCVAHGINPKLVGKNLRDMRDAEGKYIVRAFIDVASTKAGNGWVEYKWPNPVSGAVERKAGYVERLGNLIVGSGIYK